MCSVSVRYQTVRLGTIEAIRLKATSILFFNLIFITVLLFCGLISAADRDEPREVPNPRKKEIPRITLKNISSPFKNYEYYRDYEMYGQENPNRPNERGSLGLIPDSFKDHVPLLYAIHLWNNVVGIPNY